MSARPASERERVRRAFSPARAAAVREARGALCGGAYAWRGGRHAVRCACGGGVARTRSTGPPSTRTQTAACRGRRGGRGPTGRPPAPPRPRTARGRLPHGRGSQRTPRSPCARRRARRPSTRTTRRVPTSVHVQPHAA
eukprot:7389505-Prymnesium_polylepis.2